MKFSDQLCKYAEWAVLFLLFSGVQVAVISYLIPNSRSPSFSKTESSLLNGTPVDADQCNCDLLSNGNSILIPTYPVRGPLPWNVLNEEMKSSFTLSGTIRVQHKYLFEDASTKPGNPIVYNGHMGAKFVNEWTKSEIQRMIGIAKQGNSHKVISSYGSVTEKIMRTTLKKYPVKGLSVLVIGSQRPWLESFCLAYGAGRVTTVDFNVPKIEDESLIRGISIESLAKSREKFDAVFSYSSLEHDGLGRYGDPFNPNGDIERMKKVANLLSPNGKLYLGVPMGNDTLVWNAHRVYGRIRFPLLIQGWKLLESVGFFDYDKHSFKAIDQPIHVLVPEMQ